MPNYIKLALDTIKNWWIPLVVGLIFLIVGIISFARPEDTYDNLSKLFSLAFLVSGILEIYFALSNRTSLKGWGWLMVTGIFSVFAAAMMFGSPLLASSSLAFLVAFVLLYRSFQGISQALEMRAYNDENWNLIFWVSILASVLSLILLFNPDLAALGLVFWTATAFILVGILSITVAFGLRRIKRLPVRAEKKVKEGYNELKENIGNRIDQIEDRVEDTVENIQDNIEDTVDNIKDGIEDGIDNLKDGAKDALNKLRGKK